MDEREQFKSFVSSVLDLHRDNFIELLRNPEFQNNDIQRKETAVHYVSELFKEEICIAVDSFVNQTLSPKGQ